MQSNIKVNYYIGKKLETHLSHPIYNDRCFPFAVVLYVHSGSYLVWKSGFWRRYTAGEAFVIKPFTYHMVKIDEPSVVSWAHISWRTPGDMDVLSYFEFPEVFKDECADEIGHVCGKIADVVSDKNGTFIASLLLQKEALSLLSLLVQYHGTLYNGATESTKFKEAVISYIFERIGTDISVSEMADCFHLSPSAFRRKFIRLLNTTPKDFIQERILERAFEYLSYDDMTISEVASKMGYNDPGYFSKVFTKKYRMTPSYYRNVFRDSLKKSEIACDPEY